MCMIIQEISKNLEIPFKNIKVIGSAHIGFSLVKPLESSEIKYYDETSDIDIAIISKSLFYKLYKSTVMNTSYFKDNTNFSSPVSERLFKDNLLKGYIRPDTIGDKILRKEWLNFFKGLGKEIEIKISAAVYLDEDAFHNKLKEAINIYKNKLEG